MAHPPPLWATFQWFSTQTGKSFCLISNLNPPSFSLKPLLLVLLGQALLKCLSPSFVQSISKHWMAKFLVAFHSKWLGAASSAQTSCKSCPPPLGLLPALQGRPWVTHIHLWPLTLLPLAAPLSHKGNTPQPFLQGALLLPALLKNLISLETEIINKHVLFTASCSPLLTAQMGKA